MRRINMYVTDEAYEFIKFEAGRLGMGMGSLITMLALDKRDQRAAMGLVNLFTPDELKRLVGERAADIRAVGDGGPNGA